ncbi:MAG: hypothetical protein LBO65_05875 [Spirochaetaceae bacterium]|jgi:hypothetical protein|nr:hypothetical protein [Spirochaetaceae bacterium]
MIYSADFYKILGFRQVGESFYGKYLQYWLELKKTGEETVSLYAVVNKTVPLEAMKKSLLEIDGFENIELTGNTLVTAINIAGLATNETLVKSIDKIIKTYSKFGVKTVCQLCELNTPDGYYKYDNKIVPLCDDCVTKTNAKKDELKSADFQSYVIGSIGALVGALLGSIVWILIGLLGYYASIGGVAISYASFAGYTKLGGKSNKAAIIIIAISVLIAVVFAELAGLGIEIMKYLKSKDVQVSLSELIQIMGELLKEGESIGDMIRSMLLGLLFAGLGSLGLLKNISQAAKEADMKIEKI